MWAWFWILNSRRQSGMESNPISYLEIEAWKRATNTYVLPEEVDALIQMDTAYMEAQAKNREAMRNQSD